MIRYWLVFAACFGLLVFRGWDRLTHPELFAEGMKFMGRVLNEGWWTLFEIQDQALHIAPKLVALLVANLAPVADMPFYTNLACYAATAAVAASMSRSCYRWIIPADAARIALSLLLVMAPGLIEILGNLAGLHWSLLLWLGLLMLKDPEQRLKIWELVLAAVTCLSSAGSVVFLPLAFFRMLLARGREAAARDRPAPTLPRFAGEATLFAVLFLTVAFLAFHFFSLEKKIALDYIDIHGARRDLGDLLPSLGALFTTFYVLHPFLGTQHASLFLVSMPFYPLIAVSITVIAVMLYRLYRLHDHRFWLIPLWIACLLALAVMLSIVRYWAFYGIFSYPYWDWWTRYNFVFACTGLVFWFLLLRPGFPHGLKHWSSLLTVAIVLAYASQADTTLTRAQRGHQDDGFAVKRYGEERYWSKTAEELERSMKTGCPPEVEVKGFPRGKWKFVYESPLGRKDCPGDD